MKTYRRIYRSFASPYSPNGRRPGVLRVLAVCACLLAAGCAKGPVARLLPGMGNMYVAQHYFGPPANSETLPDGSTRHEWLLDRLVEDPAHYEMRRVYLGHDCDGFPVYEDVEVYIRDRVLHQTCRIVVVADREGRVLQAQSQGNSCEQLLRVPTTY